MKTAGAEWGGTDDRITHIEVWGVWNAIKVANSENRKVVQGPIRGLQSALRHIGWEYTEPMVVTTGQGVEIHLDEMSPSMLWKLIVKAARWISESDLSTRLVERGVIKGEEEVHWQAVMRAMRGLQGRERSLLMQHVWGTLPTNMWLGSHGWAVDKGCTRGHHDDSLRHRIQCPAHEWSGPDFTEEELAGLIMKEKAPGKKEIPMGIQCWRNGEMVDPEDFEFDEGDVFTDGSAVGVGWDEVEECGAAAIQFDKGQCHVVRMRIGALPAAAVCAEHVGLLLAQRYSRAGTRVISDCQAVIQGFQKWRGGEERDSSTETLMGAYGHRWVQLRWREGSGRLLPQW